MKPAFRKGLLGIHLIASVGWVGGAMAYVALGLAAQWSDDPAFIRGAWQAFEIIGWRVLVPEATLTILTGLALARWTAWGLLRHYWVIVTQLLTAFCAAILVLHMRDVSATVDFARTAGPADALALGGDLLHSSVGLAFLVGILALNVYKPRGLTRLGSRRQRSRLAGGIGRG